MTPTNNEIRAPYHVRVKTSRPVRQCRTNALRKVLCSDSDNRSPSRNKVTRSEQIPQTESNRSGKFNPPIANLFFRNRRHASFQYERDGLTTDSAWPISCFFGLNQSSGIPVRPSFADHHTSPSFLCNLMRGSRKP